MDLYAALLQLSAYGFLVRTVVEVLQGVWRPKDMRLIKGVVVGVSAVFVYVLGVDPVAMLKMKAVEEIAGGPIGVALLSGAAMGTHDILDFLKNAGTVRR